VFDLESPSSTFSCAPSRSSPLAAQAAVAIENARLYEKLSVTEARLEKELRFAKRVQAALLPTELPKRIKGIDLAASFASARELGGDFHDFLLPDSNTLIVALGDVSGKGVPAALKRAAGEFRGARSAPFCRVISPAALSSINTILTNARSRYYCTLLYSAFDEAAHAHPPQRALSHSHERETIERDRRQASRSAVHEHRRDELTMPPPTRRLRLLLDEVYEAMNSRSEEFTAAGAIEVSAGHAT
jgi:hypothetical protein